MAKIKQEFSFGGAQSIKTEGFKEPNNKPAVLSDQEEDYFCENGLASPPTIPINKLGSAEFLCVKAR